MGRQSTCVVNGASGHQNPHVLQRTEWRHGAAGPTMGVVPSWGSFSYAFGPLVAFALIAAFVVILRWAFGRKESVVAAPASPGTSSEYGLLVPVASPRTYIEGEVLRRQLEDAGIRANLATTLDGPRVLVWPDDVERARRLLTGRR